MGIPYAEVIGDPIAHSKSPLIHNFWLKKLGLDGEYRKTPVRPGEIADYFLLRRPDADWRGCNVTAPLKQEVLRTFAQRDRCVLLTGSANCAVPRGGDRLSLLNTDVAGILHALRGVELKGRRVAIIGAGGAARAALHLLEMSGAARTTFLVRDAEKASALREVSPVERPMKVEFYNLSDVRQAMTGAHLVINASPLGSTAGPQQERRLLDELQHVAGDATVFDMVYDPQETQLLKEARALRLAVVDGLHMLVGQAAPAFEKFFGEPAPRQHDAELRELLTS